MGLVTQLCWRQPWGKVAISQLLRAFQDLGGEVKELPSQDLDVEALTIGGVRDVELAYFANAGNGWSSLLLPLDAWVGPDLARRLSGLHDQPVLEILEHEQSVWGYRLYQEKQVIDQFWSRPELVDEKPARCSGNAAVLAEALRAAENELAPYLLHLTNTDLGQRRAFPEDGHTLEEPWVRIDLLRRAGIVYPDPGKSEGRHIQVIEPQRRLAKGQGKPWWKVW